MIGDTYRGVREGVARAILTESRDPIDAAANVRIRILRLKRFGNVLLDSFS